MATVVLKSIPVHTSGELPKVGSLAPNFILTGNDLIEYSLKDFSGNYVVLNVLHSVDTSTCSKSIIQLNEISKNSADIKVLCISKDLPFAMRRYIADKNLENIQTLSDFRTGNFGRDYGLDFIDGPLKTLLSRCVIVLNKQGKIIHTEQVYENSDEPDYDAAFNAIKSYNG